jgi:hypothetical protein
MIEKNIQVYPGDNATLTDMISSVRCMLKKSNFLLNYLVYFLVCCEVYTRGTVIYVQEVRITKY